VWGNSFDFQQVASEFQFVDESVDDLACRIGVSLARRNGSGVGLCDLVETGEGDVGFYRLRRWEERPEPGRSTWDPNSIPG
jgi:hypothetical protein